jgi:uncharacterized protein (DUF433 family)
MSEIVRDPETMGGLPVFRGTRVLAKTLFDYLKAGDSVADFLDDFPSVSKEQVVSVLAEAESRFELVE